MLQIEIHNTAKQRKQSEGDQESMIRFTLFPAIKNKGKEASPKNTTDHKLGDVEHCIAKLIVIIIGREKRSICQGACEHIKNSHRQRVATGKSVAGGKGIAPRQNGSNVHKREKQQCQQGIKARSFEQGADISAKGHPFLQLPKPCQGNATRKDNTVGTGGAHQHQSKAKTERIFVLLLP